MAKNINHYTVKGMTPEQVLVGVVRRQAKSDWRLIGELEKGLSYEDNFGGVSINIILDQVPIRLESSDKDRTYSMKCYLERILQTELIEVSR